MKNDVITCVHDHETQFWSAGTSQDHWAVCTRHMVIEALTSVASVTV